MWNGADGHITPISDINHANGIANVNGNASSFRQTQQLLGVYPFASATPSTHVARHLSNLSISATPPSYIQASHYTSSGNYGNTPLFYAETSQLSALSASQLSSERAYWNTSRNDAVRMLGDQTAVNYYSSLPSHWHPAPAPSSYQLSPFAQSVMHHAAPHNAYPTPPPGSIPFSSSSSSLANALGTPTSGEDKHVQKKRETHRSPNDSTEFFNNFLEEKVKELPKAQQPRNMGLKSSPPSTPRINQSSPDPLHIGSPASSPLTPLTTSQVTPKKRKLVEVVIETPSKRPSASSKMLSLRPSSPHTPQTSTSSTVIKADDTRTPTHTPRMQVYVEVTPPPKTWTTPSHFQLQRSLGSSDLGGYGSEDEDDYARRRETMMNSIRSTGKKTGDRDDRAPLEKFLNLLDDIFEAEDNISADADLSSLPLAFFSQLSLDPARPLLHPTLIAKLTKSISKVARPTKRVRLASVQWDSNVPGTPRRAGGMVEVESQTLLRVLKLLERSVRIGEDLDPFGYLIAKRGGNASDSAPSHMSPTKAGKARMGKKRMDVSESEKTSKSPADNGNAQEGSKMDLDDEFLDLTDDELENLEQILETARDSIIAADCCIALLTSDRLPKQLYSEELITSCLATIKNQLTRIIYPFIEGPASDAREYSPILQYITNRMPKGSRLLGTTGHRRLITETFQALASVLPRINNLVCADMLAMSDSIIIQVVYIAIGPFFVVENGGESDNKGKKDPAILVITDTLGSSGMRGLRLEALSLVRSIFANHEDQRSWIIEEILSSLIKLSDSKQKAGQFRLRDGRSIRTVSALLLQLVQTSAHNVRVEARRVAKARQQHFALKRQDSITGDTRGPFLDEKDLEEVRLYSAGLEAPTKAAKAIVLFLTQRSGKGKSTKNANEQEYRSIFDNLISDLLVVLFWPEWPAASLVLSIVCRYMITSLDDVKSSNNENNASKAMALDHLGVIACRLRANLMKWGKTGAEEITSPGLSLRSVDEVLPTADGQGLNKLISVHQEVSSHLSKRSSEDQAYESARELNAVMWGQELANALNQLNETVSNIDDEFPGAYVSKNKILTFGGKIKSALRDVWKDAPTDVFDNATQEEILRVDKLAEQIGTTQALKNAFDPILNVIIVALDAPPVFVRTKALRALSQILSVDSSVLSNPNVRHAIESHLLDSSPQVRDAAVELIGKYMIDSSVVAGDYYQKIAERIADTGLGVRKRVIKLLKSFYPVTDDMNRRIDICSKLVLRMLDEDDTVKDLAIKTLEELWFVTSAPSGHRTHGQGDPSSQLERGHLLATVSVIMGVCGNFKDRQSPLEDMLNKIVSGKEGADVSALRLRLAELCDALIDGLVDASDFMNFTVINCIRTIHLFTIACPPIISGTKASTLLPYLKNPTTAEEHITSDYILKIYRASIPHMSKTSAKFGNDLQLLLQPMVLKPNAQAGLGSLQETVACLCAVVQHLTHDFVRLVALLKSCNLRVQQYISREASQINVQESRALHILVLIVSLLGEHFNFDQIREESDDLKTQLNSGPIVRHIYACILQLYDKYTENNIRGRLLICLGFLFRAQPTLMTLESSATMMDAIFESPEEENRGRLLKLMQEFLVAESTKHSVQEKGLYQTAKTNALGSGVNMEELVGNTHGFAESGVSSAIVQRYLAQILDAALSPLPQIQAPAVDILSYTIKQGLAHPLLSFPFIVALETSPVNALSARAVTLHTVLHHKHASLLNSGFISACRKSYEYQCKIIETNGGEAEVQGFRMQPTPTALLARWYALVREKRATRQEFLRAVLRVFELRDSAKTEQDAVRFIRYMAENFASFDYRTQEEVLTVLKILTRELAETGSLLVERIAPGNLLTQLKPTQEHDKELGEELLQAPALYTPGSPVKRGAKELSVLPMGEQLALMRASCIIGMIMLLKAHLKTVYGLSEDKCQKFIMGKKSAVGDRVATRRKDTAISWERMPFAVKPILTSEDVEVHKSMFLEVWNEDGATAEPEGDEWE
ncbi:hypothetical protein DFH11DRAFT_1508962 [Phellopilus nigrolimitatus]|nr:hypothetical protein DFH11DRAFT_1508962 [Phellopilus nigrolimitatus]